MRVAHALQQNAMLSITNGAVKEHLYCWEGRDRLGRTLRGQIMSPEPSHVEVQLRRQGVYLTSVRRHRAAGPFAWQRQDLAVFTRQLATMSLAGVPLLQSLDLIGRGLKHSALAVVLQQVRQDVATGQQLSAAMRQHPGVFSPLYCGLLDVGESAGVMDQTLERLALHEEKALALRSQLRSALLYPAAVLAVAVTVVALILIVVVPTFEDVFASFGAELPPMTRMVLSLSAFMAQWWWVLLGAVFAAGFGARAAVRRSERLQGAADAAVLALPGVGALMGRVLVARWTRTLSTLLGAGVPLVDALARVAGAAGDRVFSQATRQVQRAVSSGQRISRALAGARIFPAMVVQMAAIGEESGSLDQMLGKTADFFEAEVDARVKGLASLLEPLMIVILGLLIGGIVVALYLPIFQLGAIA